MCEKSFLALNFTSTHFSFTSIPQWLTHRDLQFIEQSINHYYPSHRRIDIIATASYNSLLHMAWYRHHLLRLSIHLVSQSLVMWIMRLQQPIHHIPSNNSIQCAWMESSIGCQLLGLGIEPKDLCLFKDNGKQLHHWWQIEWEFSAYHLIPDGPPDKFPYDSNGVKLCMSHHPHYTASDELSSNYNALLDAGMRDMGENLQPQSTRLLPIISVYNFCGAIGQFPEMVTKFIWS